MLDPVEPFLFDGDDDLTVAHQARRAVVAEVDSQDQCHNALPVWCGAGGVTAGRP
jgi:hypothetical protein